MVPAVLLVDGMLADIGAGYRVQLTAAAAVLVVVIGGLLSAAPPARVAATARSSAARSGTDVSLGPYLFAWAAGLAMCGHTVLAIRRTAALPATSAWMALAALALLAAVVRGGLVISRRQQSADRTPLLHDRPLLAIALAWLLLAGIGSGLV
jgi:hypothetical protein